MVKKKRKVILVGIAGSNNAFSLSLYNLKAYAYQNLTARDRWDIDVIQHPLINPGQSINKRILSDLTKKIISKRPYLIGFSCYMWNLDSFLKTSTT